MSQLNLIEIEPDWRELYQGFPAYEMDDKEPWKSLLVHFRDNDELQEVAKKLGLRLTPDTKSVWAFPEERENYQWICSKENPTRYPIYIISKGRAGSRLTSRSLEAMGADYKIVIEPQEYDEYSAVIHPAKILVLPFSNLGQGSIPARNFVWQHAAESGAKKHWILDDNINGFVRQHRNTRKPIVSNVGFRVIENWSDRFSNLGLSGMQYRFLGGGTASEKIPPFILNTRVYSCILINHELDEILDERWRGRYNEDTDLSLRVLKSNWCTALFNSFKCNKSATMTMSGGNTDELYDEQIQGRLLMAESLAEQHPHEVRVSEKWGRPQHHVDYSRFRKNKLIPIEDLKPASDDEYGLKKQETDTNDD